jgi:hypothetical protein
MTLLLSNIALALLPAADTHRVADVPALVRAAATAKPGDTILVAPGEYAGNCYLRNVHGTAAAPITVAGADPKDPPRFTGKTTPLHLSGVSHLELRDLIVANTAGNGINIDDAGDPDKPTHHVTLRKIQVRDVGPKGNIDGLKLSGVDDFFIDGCTVERWGSTGSGIDMVGCHRGLVVGCTFRNGGSNGVQAKGGSAEVVVRNCRFEDAGQRGVNLGGATGDAYFRPRLTAMPANGRYEAKDIRVEGCTFVGGGAAAAFVGVDGATVRYNTIYRPGRYAIRILQEKADAGFVPCRNGVFERNVVVFRSDSWSTGGVNVGPKTEPGSFKFAGNLWYCEDRPGSSAPRLPTAEMDGVIGKNPMFADAAKGDFGVAAGSPASDRGAHAMKETGGR